jgi:hypothetical protein
LSLPRDDSVERHGVTDITLLVTLACVASACARVTGYEREGILERQNHRGRRKPP